MDEHLVQSTLNYHRFANPGKISITPTMSMVNQRNPALAYCWECGLDTVRMHSDRDNETDEEATSQVLIKRKRRSGQTSRRSEQLQGRNLIRRIAARQYLFPRLP